MARKWWTLTAVSVGLFMLLLDITIVDVVLQSQGALAFRLSETAGSDTRIPQ